MADLQIDFLDVGQGDGIFVQFPNGQTMLVDLGSKKWNRLTGGNIRTFFVENTKFKNKNQDLDILVLTHGDIDHYNMVYDFIDNLTINVRYLIYGGREQDYNKLIGRIRQLCPKCIVGTIWNTECPRVLTTMGGVELTVLACNAPCSTDKDDWQKNSSSVVLSLTYGKTRVLLAGDATRDTEKFIEKTLILKYGLDGRTRLLSSAILKMGHHGSQRTSNRSWWLWSINPTYVFVSSDRSGGINLKKKIVGYRLPQLLTLHMVAHYCPQLAKNCAVHNIVSWYDPQDYRDFSQTVGKRLEMPPAPVDFMAKRSWGQEWVETPTKRGLFTTIAWMDANDPVIGEHDQGSQYTVIIGEDGIKEILGTDPSHVSNEDELAIEDEDDNNDYSNNNTGTNNNSSGSNNNTGSPSEDQQAMDESPAQPAESSEGWQQRRGPRLRSLLDDVERGAAS